MIIKTFTDESSAAALKVVRDEMGGEAIVLKTRQITRPGLKPAFEVTACLENASVAKTSALLSDSPKKQVTVTEAISAPEPTPIETPEPAGATEKPEETKVEAVACSDELDERITSIDRKLNQLINLGIQPDGISRLELFQTVHRRLKEADLPDDYLESFMSSLVENYDNTSDISEYARQKLAKELEATIEHDIDFQPGDKVIFVGPAGSGKSSAMGKLAATLTARQKRKVRLLSLDDQKLAAFDEICSYAEILGLEVVPPPSAKETESKDNDAITLIDTPALPTQRERVQALKQRIDDVEPNYRFAVFSCLTRSRDVFQISKTLKELNPTHLILSMQDLASCHGTVVTAAKALGLKIAFLSDSPGGMGELKAPDPQTLANQFMDVEVTRDQA